MWNGLQGPLLWCERASVLGTLGNPVPVVPAAAFRATSFLTENCPILVLLAKISTCFSFLFCGWGDINDYVVSCLLKCFILNFLKRSVPFKALSFWNSSDLIPSTSLCAKVGFCMSNQLKCAFKSGVYSFSIFFKKAKRSHIYFWLFDIVSERFVGMGNGRFL